MAGLFDKAKDALHSEKAEEISDSALDAGAKLASKLTGGKHDEKIAELRNKADEKVGTEEQ